MDDIMFAHSGPYRGVSIPLQRVTQLRLRAQANPPVASYWLRPVIHDGDTRRVHHARGAGDGVCNALLSALLPCLTCFILWKETDGLDLSCYLPH